VTHAIGLQLVDRTPRARACREHIIDCLDGAQATDPDGDGTWEIRLDAPSAEDALKLVWNAVAAAGADDHVVIIEHPQIAHHWEHRPAGDCPPQR
jgi:hypothetical protein